MSLVQNPLHLWEYVLSWLLSIGQVSVIDLLCSALAVCGLGFNSVAEAVALFQQSVA